MNAKKFKILSYCLVVLMTALVGFAESPRQAVKQGNELYHDGKLPEAIEKYDQAAAQSPQSLEPTFNKANSLYKQNEIDKAIDIYKQLAGKSENPNLSAKANYNLGNCYYNKAAGQAKENPQNAIEDFKTGINYWRKAKEANLDDTDVSKNIEVAKMTIKQLKEQMQQQQKQQQDKQDKNKDEQNKDQQKQDQKQDSSSDPNKPQEEKKDQQEQQSQDEKDKQQQQEKQDQQQAKSDPNQNQNQDQPQVSEPNEAKPQDKPEEDMAAQKILDKEQKQKEERKKLQRATYKKVEKDW